MTPCLTLPPKSWGAGVNERPLTLTLSPSFLAGRGNPETPVVVCWIEGGWGTYTSYAGGKPTKNKRMDFWRRIDVAVSEPQLLAPETLADSRATRVYLMRLCLQARGYLGLEVPPLPDRIEEETDNRTRPQEQMHDAAD